MLPWYAPVPLHHLLEAANLTFRVTMERRDPGWLLNTETSAQPLQLLFPPLGLLVLVTALLKMCWLLESTWL